MIHVRLALRSTPTRQRNGLYQGLTDWQIKGDKLVGKLTVPLAVATVGGASNILPKAKASLAMLDIDSAKELAQSNCCSRVSSKPGCFCVH